MVAYSNAKKESIRIRYIMEQHTATFIVRVVAFSIWLIFVVSVGRELTRTRTQTQESFEDGIASGTASAPEESESLFNRIMSGKITDKIAEKTTASDVKTIKPKSPEDLYARCMRLDSRIRGFTKDFQNNPTAKDIDKNITEMVKWYEASNPKTSATMPTIEGFEARSVTYEDVEKKVNGLALFIGLVGNEFTKMRQRMDPVYNWYRFKTQEEAKNKKVETFETAVTKPPKPAPMPEILSEQIDNLEKQMTNIEIQADLLLGDYSKLHKWYQNTIRLEREQNAKAIEATKTQVAQQINQIAQSQSNAPMPPGVAPPTGDNPPPKPSDVTGVITSSIESSAQTPEQQAQVAKAMASVQNI
jgi:hypothetical protein